VKLVGSGLGDVIDLGGAIAALVNLVGKRVDGNLRNRISAQYQVGREPTIQIGERVVGFEPIHNVAV